MATFLFKSEPGEFAWSDLIRERRTAWTGVTSPAAQKHMRSIRKGDEVLLYHTGDERRIAGLARVLRGAYPDPERPGETAAGETKFVLVDIGPVRASTRDEATLAAVKHDPRFAGFALVREPRLSVMPVPPELDGLLRGLAGL